MEVVNTRFEFSYSRKKYTAEVSMFTPLTTPMVRVRVDTKEFKELIFIYYKIKQGELYWYPLYDYWKEGMAKAIANALLI